MSRSAKKRRNPPPQKEDSQSETRLAYEAGKAEGSREQYVVNLEGKAADLTVRNEKLAARLKEKDVERTEILTLHRQGYLATFLLTISLFLFEWLRAHGWIRVAFTSALASLISGTSILAHMFKLPHYIIKQISRFF